MSITNQTRTTLNSLFGINLNEEEWTHVTLKLQEHNIDLTDTDELEDFISLNWRVDTTHGRLLNDGFAVTSDDGEWGFFEDLEDAINWLEANGTDASKYKQALNASLNGEELPLDIFSVWTEDA